MLKWLGRTENSRLRDRIVVDALTHSGRQRSPFFRRQTRQQKPVAMLRRLAEDGLDLCDMFAGAENSFIESEARFALVV